MTLAKKEAPAKAAALELEKEAALQDARAAAMIGCRRGVEVAGLDEDPGQLRAAEHDVVRPREQEPAPGNLMTARHVPGEVLQLDLVRHVAPEGAHLQRSAVFPAFLESGHA